MLYYNPAYFFQIKKEFTLRTDLTEECIDANFEKTVSELGLMYKVPSVTDRDKLKILEMTEDELRVNAGKSYSKAFTVLEVGLKTELIFSIQ